jgi:hypothetical protein
LDEILGGAAGFSERFGGAFILMDMSEPRMSEGPWGAGEPEGRVYPPREPRAKAALACEVLGGRGKSAGRVRDFGPGGCRVDCPEPYDIPSLLVLTLHVPGLPAPVDFPAELRWRGGGGDPGSSALGCRFIHSPRSRREAEALFATLAVMASARGPGGDSTHRLPSLPRP